MKKKLLIGILALGTAAFFSISAFTGTPPPSDDNRCCPEGWDLICNTGGVTNNASKDNNDDGCLCRKNIPGNNANGNNQGPVDARNWKDNNQPCD